MNRIAELEESIKHHSQLYYNNPDSTEISDAEFDRLVDELRALSPESSVLKEVGSRPVSVWPVVKHVIPMGSQLKVNEPQELEVWASKMGTTEFIWSEKLDGSSVSLEYLNGVFTRAVTRGDGIEGEDITQNVRKMFGVPQNIQAGGAFYVRAEIIMSKSTFQSKYQGIAKNPRNAAAGIARRIDGEGAADLEIVAFDCTDDVFQKQSDKFLYLTDQCFLTPMWGTSSINDIKQTHADYVKTLRDKCPYEIDGLVVGVESIALTKTHGFVDNRPKAQRAYKFPAEEKTSILQNVVWQTGRTGRVTPVAEIEPCEIGGVTITRVMLDNIGLIQQLNLELGCMVLVQRRNDVIPKIIQRIDLVSAQLSGPIIPPTQCPSCRSAIKVDGAYLVCTNTATCAAQIIGHLAHFLDVLKVKGFGDVLLQKLYDAGILRTPIDFYLLTAANIAGCEGFSEKIGHKLLKEFKSKSQEVSLPEFVEVLSIPGVGQHAVELLQDKYPTLESLFEAKESDLLQIKGVGEFIAHNLVEGLRQRKTIAQDLQNYLKIRGSDTPSVEILGDKCKGWVFIETGFRDPMLIHRMLQQGGTHAKSLNKTVTHLIARDTNEQTTKMKKAIENGVIVMSAQQVKEYLDGNS